MRELVVVSGKGGVGKSSIAASLAVLLNEAGVRVTAIDSDVDAPNLSIILGADIPDYMEIQASEKASIDSARCIKCGKCLSVCKMGALFNVSRGEPALIPFLCEGCGACAVICPVDAISINRVTNGRIGIAETSYGFPIVSGQLNMGESSSGHVVTAVKSKGRSIAEDSGSDLVIIDAPPGIGCPVIAAIAGADYALAVTEPTPAARNSLDRVLGILAHFNIPTSVVINRFDLNPRYSEEMEDWIQARWSIPVAQRIPLDYNVPISLSNRVPVIKYNPKCEASKSIISLSNWILKKLGSNFSSNRSLRNI